MQIQPQIHLNLVQVNLTHFWMTELGVLIPSCLNVKNPHFKSTNSHDAGNSITEGHIAIELRRARLNRLSTFPHYNLREHINPKP